LAAYPTTAEFNQQVADAKAKGLKVPTRPRLPVEPGHNQGTPSSLYNAMIHPLLNYGIQGAIWYQGEANATSMDRADQYADLFQLMIKDWRTRWGQGDFPFIFVQLASYTKSSAVPVDQPWSHLRESQLKTLQALPNTGMAVTIDIGAGTNIHPPDKLDVGYRLALWAENLVWNKGVVDSGPLYDGMKVDGNSIRVHFKSVGDGLVIGAPPSTKLGEKNDTPGVPATQPADHLIGFEIAGADKKFVFADAAIDDESVVVHSDSVPNPVAVRYAWASLPKDCNLYNKNRLPASPFRTDSW
jgi:sialate O-acetylesterase